MINAGWANNCGVELFTLGWVRCPSDDDLNHTYDGFRGTDYAIQEEEELLIIARAFIEIISRGM